MERVLTNHTLNSRHMALAGMAVAFQSLQVCISHKLSPVFKDSQQVSLSQPDVH